jgi:hypothetical protein
MWITTFNIAISRLARDDLRFLTGFCAVTENQSIITFRIQEMACTVTRIRVEVKGTSNKHYWII